MQQVADQFVAQVQGLQTAEALPTLRAETYPQPIERPREWSSPTSSIWRVSVLGGPPVKIRDGAVACVATVSPDGHHVAITEHNEHLDDGRLLNPALPPAPEPTSVPSSFSSLIPDP